ncbi:pantoate--beta-alanine ligase [Salisaeta longa]|uniref:pantoate--beta-alanine ligase n=1 Tax=Salisaeta longa TaxID=503170 RepID=UPI0003B6843E|nr:pantoate--beta-alanine ligase [Salisaeta longa]
MKVFRTVDAMQQHARSVARTGRTHALVPTMGALHDGHLALVREALDHADHVTVSIFVNPTQFAPDEDYESYPRTLDADREQLDALGVDAVFAPSVDEMYPHHADDTLAGPLAWVTVDRLNETLCGRYRDGHFRGVTTVVTKLFNACRPDVAVFGEKDAQQLVILRRMTDELLFDIDIVGVPIVRAPDGLARSSRNAYLSEDERAQATVLSDAVSAARARIEAGEQRAEAVVGAMQQALRSAPDARVQYAEVVDAHTLRPVDTLHPGQDVLAAVAVFFGDTRLIDNAFVTVPAA